ncbi:hypothetical protein S40293_05476 [Stachybotrys chartarum IBT 40293]|nr:hypothetical protein S40293_05476 [Stachybotrys chartarum IBT 40293]
MPDDNLPTYTLQVSADNPLHTILYFTHNGSDPSADFLLKRPAPAESRGRYALGLLDVHVSSLVYAEVLLEPDWAQPTLSAAEVRAQNGVPVPPIAVTPDAFVVSLYNPDQAVAVRRNQGSWKTDSWDFEIPERTFKMPSASQIDQDSAEPQVPEAVPKVTFRWKRDGRLSRDMTCYMTGRSVGGKKSKDPDITVAMYHGGKSETSITIYEPNMARVEVEDMKGLEMTLLLSAEVIRDLYLSPRPDLFNTAAAPGQAGASTSRPRKGSRPSRSPPAAAAMSGALNARPQSPPTKPAPQREPRTAQTQAEIDAETRRLREMVAEEERRDRERRDREEQDRIKRMLDQEENDRRRREAEVEAETERLRQQYGGQGSSSSSSRPQDSGASSPPLPPRPNAGASWYGPPATHAPPKPPRPARPASAGPGQMRWSQYQQPPAPQHAPPQQQQQQQPQQNRGRLQHGLGKLLQHPYANNAAASVSGFFGSGGGGHRNDDERHREDDRKKKIKKKRSVHF